VKIALVGDIHGSALPLVQAAQQADVIVQLGDFGLDHEAAAGSAVPVYWIGGNREHFRLFSHMQQAEAPVQWADNCFYVPRGVVLELGKQRFLCLGGGDSVSRYNKGVDWSSRERITGFQISRALSVTGRVDAILSHTPPQSTISKHFDPAAMERDFKLPRWWTSPTACATEVIWQHFRQPPLFCSHMHQSVSDERGVRILDIGEIVVLDSDVPARESLSPQLPA
jgi:hypothetical protein